jgi:hypothetical protein
VFHVYGVVDNPQVAWYKTVLRIHDILMWIWIRIRGSMPLTSGSGSEFEFAIDLQDANKKLV